MRLWWVNTRDIWITLLIIFSVFGISYLLSG